MDAWTITLVVLGLLVLGAVAWVATTYHRFARMRVLVEEAWRQVDVELERRHDVVPLLVRTVGAVTGPEREVLADVDRARAEAAAPGVGPARQAEQENALTAALGRLFAVAEAHPEVRTREDFLALQSELTNTEDRIAAGRRFYNANVRQLNTRVTAFPAALVARVLGFGPAEYFQASDPVVRLAPAVTYAAPDEDGGAGRTAPA
ncbi:LemA family protein [Georgenia faecalis]|uniref:LemA family protein n=1 Tax=Georgenia faecalis TaxID=2483799 RepID=A0ABV9D8J7_9MICO|nr:LemA family protein [Georgenia faecalis]